MRFKGQIWIERNLFFFLVDAEKNLGISLVMMMMMMILLIMNKNSAISEEKILHLSFLSLSLSFNYLVPISAGIARVVKVKLARAQGVHDDVEDTELTGG